MSEMPSISPLTADNLISRQASEIEDMYSDGDTESSLSTIKVGGKPDVTVGDSQRPHDGSERPNVAGGLAEALKLEDRPGLLRKKSGELIKSSLKLNGLGRSMSASQLGSSKSVRFATRLANVKMFDGQESPSTVSTADNTPMSSPQGFDELSPKGYFDLKWDDDEVSDITSDTSSDDEQVLRATQYRIEHLDFYPPRNIYDKQDMGCYLQSIKLSPEKNALVGLIMVKNLAFEKKLSIKLTFNNWRSSLIINNITYSKSFASVNFDQFKFVIPLEHMPKNIDLQFVIRYDVDGRTYWDNNSTRNYHLTLAPFEPLNIKTHTYNFKNTVSQFDELVTKLVQYRKADYALDGDLIDRHNDEYVYSKKPFSTKAKSDFHNRYNINDNLSEPRSNPFISTPLIRVQPPSTTSPSSDSAPVRPPLKMSYLTSDISKVRPKYSKSYKTKQSTSEEGGNTNFNSQFYTNLLQSYCFYNGDQPTSVPSTSAASHFTSTNNFSNASTASTLQSYSDSIYI